MKQFYLIIDLASVIVPFLFSFHPKIQFYKKWKALFPALLVSFLIFIPWDIVFTQIGIWGFNSDYLIGINFFNLPFEEALFFICIPYACVFSYYCFNKFMKTDHFYKVENKVSIFLVLFLLILSALNYNRLYTSVTFTALALLILFLKFVLKINWLHKFYFSYCILLIPFFIVNGLLTGAATVEPVVRYNNNQNLGIRMLTIPFEDIFYGMFLLLLTVSVYEYFSKKYEG